MFVSKSKEFQAHNLGIYCIKYTEYKSVDLIHRNKDNAPTRYIVKTVTNNWVKQKHVFIDQTSVIINPVNEGPVTGELFVTRCQLCHRNL